MTHASTTSLTGSGFTEAQATAITRTVQTTANCTVETLRDELARWHVYLALYLLIQIGIVFLTMLLLLARNDARLSPITARAVQDTNLSNATSVAS